MGFQIFDLQTFAINIATKTDLILSGLLAEDQRHGQTFWFCVALNNLQTEELHNLGLNKYMLKVCRPIRFT